MTEVPAIEIIGILETAKACVIQQAIKELRDDDTPLNYSKGWGETDSSELEALRKEIADLLRKHGGKTGEELKAEGK